MNLFAPIETIKFVGPTYAKKLSKLGIFTLRDFLYHLPFRYNDFSTITPISGLRAGMTTTIEGTVQRITTIKTRTGKFMTIASISDGTGTVSCVWFNQPYITKLLKGGTAATFSGKVDFFSKKLTFMSPEYEMGKRVHTGRLVPVYPETYGVSSKWIRSRIVALLPLISDNDDPLPLLLRQKHGFLGLREALSAVHFPLNLESAEQGRQRFAFEELLILQILSLSRRKEWEHQEVAYPLMPSYEAVQAFIRQLPFTLTGAQRRAMDELLHDLSKSTPMNRLLEGDVGSGKTVIAAIGIYAAYKSGYQSVLMAPTEILALQHARTIEMLLKPFGLKIGVFTHSTKKTVEQCDVYIGTHALLQRSVSFGKVALVCIDEQHRFGVEQRAFLKRKGGSPHVLTMTATPIPRTVALTFYGDLDLSVLNEMPVGRKTVKTWVVPPTKRESAYQWIRKQKSQAFIVCPLIEESESLKAVRAVTTEFTRLSAHVFPDLQLGLLHGRMGMKEKELVIERFRKGELDVLVSTPVVEVGIDIPKATIMMIEGAERFGLAQLHQLRGRVGRGDAQSYCLLFTDSEEQSVYERLKALEHLQSGITLAEYDMKLRGPGDIYGTRQHGFEGLRAAHLTDISLIEKTKVEAKSILDTSFDLDLWPELKRCIQGAEKTMVEPN